MQIENLMEAGLTKHQAEVYLEVLKGPGRSGGELAKRLSIDRSFAYNILNALIDKGLVSHITEKNIRLFYPSDPENLLNEIEEKRTKVSTIIEELKKINAQTKESRAVTVYEGKAGVKIYARECVERDSFCLLGGGERPGILDTLKSDFPHYLNLFENKKTRGRAITSNSFRKIMDNLFEKSEIKVRTLPNLKTRASFTIFKDKIAICSTEEKALVIMIEDRNVAETLQCYFDSLWKLAN
jgi:sugar-specific transcriptional regulator TrmB